MDTMNEQDALRREYNAAIANGLVMRARQIERRMHAIGHESWGVESQGAP